MPLPYSQNRPLDDLPPLLRRVIDAARHAVLADPGNSWQGHAEALTELAQLALIAVPLRSALAPNEDELFQAVDRIAHRHLAIKKATHAWSGAFNAIADEEERDAVEAAHLWVLSQGCTVYFYAGLAFGITLAELPHRR